MGILTNGKTFTTELTDGDFGESPTLIGILQLMRDPKQAQWLAEFFRQMSLSATVGHTLDLEALVMEAIEAFNNNQPTECYAVLVHTKLTILTEREHADLARFLTVARSGDWLSSFMSALCLRFEQGDRETPLDVARGLANNEVQKFDCNVDTTRTMLRDYSGLFSKELLTLQKAVASTAPAAASETTPKATASTRTTRRRAAVRSGRAK